MTKKPKQAAKETFTMRKIMDEEKKSTNLKKSLFLKIPKNVQSIFIYDVHLMEAISFKTCLQDKDKNCLGFGFSVMILLSCVFFYLVFVYSIKPNAYIFIQFKSFLA